LSDTFEKIFIVLHNTHAVSKVIETAQVVYGLGFNNFIVSKAEGSAAQSGVPEANKIAMKMNRRFMILPSLKDVIELLEVEKPILITSPVLTKERINISDLLEKAKNNEKVVIVLSGSNSSFSRKEMDLGDCFSLEARIDIGPAGTTAIILYGLLKQLN
jgi:SpoU rRNA methylase family enzyme